MRVLMLAHRVPYPPFTGDRLRAYHIARHLARRHQLTLACPVTEDEHSTSRQLRRLLPDVEYAPLTALGRSVAALSALAGPRPLSVGYFASRALARRVDARLAQERFDVVYVSSSPMAQYVSARELPVVLDFVDVDSDKWAQYAAATPPPRRWLYRLEARRLRRYEAQVGRQAAVAVFVTPAEEALFRTSAPDARTVVIPNGVDTEYFQPGARAAASPPTIVFTGALDYRPNVDGVLHFSDAVLPRVRAEVPDVRCLVVGRRPSRAIRRLRRQAIDVIGDVPDVRPYMRQAHVAIAPLRLARGLQNKVLEAMAMGLPVVASPGPAQGVSAMVGRDWFVETTPAAFAARVVHLLRDAGARRDVGRCARAFVQRHHDWPQVLRDVDAVVERAAVAAGTPLER